MASDLQWIAKINSTDYSLNQKQQENAKIANVHDKQK